MINPSSQVGPERQASFERRRAEVAGAEEALARVRLSAHAWRAAGIATGDAGGWHSAEALLTRPHLSLEQV